ncbi:MAG: NAD+ synthase [Planctomycetes bacterium]|nr:NAD+ synthase [Planctomycetota bacterium]
MKIALAQIDPTVGDFDGNRARILAGAASAREAGARLAVFPELAVTGYPPLDLLEEPGFLARAQESAARIAAEARGIALLFGTVEPTGSAVGRSLHNGAVLAEDGRVAGKFAKTLLPTYDVFDEDRWFEPADGPRIAEFSGRRLGVTICEDVWTIPEFFGNRNRAYRRDPVAELASLGAEAIVNLSASPWHRGKAARRSEMLAAQACRAGCPLVFVNQVGGNDSLIFDGHSAVYDAKGRVLAMAKGFQEDFLVVDLDGSGPPACHPDDTGPEALRRALVLGLADYATKTGFRSGVIGLSGGIDSSLVAAIAAQALGPANVLGVSMPSRYSSDHSLEDARILARNLGLQYKVLPIEAPFAAFLDLFASEFAGRAPDTTEENMQARIRGVILMALSNKYGHLVLSTGNKSELSVGYCTLYGDMVGGLAVISDVSKMEVYELSRHLNAGREVIPERSLVKPPSAELKPDQTDQDTLPPYETLDDILALAVEERRTAEEIAARGHDPAVVAKVLRWIQGNEYKRRQAAPGLRVTTKAFGIGRRYPIARK